MSFVYSTRNQGYEGKYRNYRPANAGDLDKVSQEVVQDIFLQLNWESLAQMQATNRFLKTWVLGFSIEVKSAEARVMLDLLSIFFQEMGCATQLNDCHSMVKEALFSKCVSFYDLKKNHSVLKFRLAQLFANSDQTVLNALVTFTSDHPLPPSFSDFFRSIDLLRSITKKLEELGPQSAHLFLGVEKFSVKKHPDFDKELQFLLEQSNPRELFIIFSHLPEFQNCYLIWFIFKTALKSDLDLARQIIDFVRAHSQENEDSNVESEEWKKNAQYRPKRMFLAMLQFMLFDFHLAKEEAAEALKVAKNFIYHTMLNAHRRTDGFFNYYLEFDRKCAFNKQIYRCYFYFCQQLVAHNAYKEAVDFCCNMQPDYTRASPLLGDIVYEIYPFIENRGLDAFLSQLFLFRKKNINVNKMVITKATQLTEEGKIEDAMHVGRLFKFNVPTPPLLDDSDDSQKLFPLINALLKNKKIVQAIEVLSWILTSLPKESHYLISGLSEILAELLDKGERDAIDKIVHLIPDSDAQKNKPDFRTQNLERVIREYLMGNRSPQNLVEAAFLANSIPDFKLRDELIDSIAFTLSQKGHLVEKRTVDRMKKKQPVAWTQGSQSCLIA